EERHKAAGQRDHRSQERGAGHLLSAGPPDSQQLDRRHLSKTALMSPRPLFPPGASLYHPDMGSPNLKFEIIANVRIGRAERRWEGGREYFVAPITSIVPGVLPGSEGPLLYLPQDIAANVKSWDGMPLTAYHPVGLDGSPTSAHEDGVAERQWIGEVRDSLFRNRLTHKGWFDIEKTKRIEPRIYNSLEQGLPIETSTGLYMKRVEAAPGSQWHGQPYTHTATKHRPD